MIALLPLLTSTSCSQGGCAEPCMQCRVITQGDTVLLGCWHLHTARNGTHLLEQEAVCWWQAPMKSYDARNASEGAQHNTQGRQLPSLFLMSKVLAVINRTGCTLWTSLTSSSSRSSNAGKGSGYHSKVWSKPAVTESCTATSKILCVVPRT